MRHNERGQSLVEMALVIPIVFLIMFGVFDVGRIVFIRNTLSDGARQGARHAAVDPENCSLIDQSVRTAVLGTALTTFTVKYITVDSLGTETGTYLLCVDGVAGLDVLPATARPGDRVVVELEASLSLATPFVAAATGRSTFDVKTDSTMQVTYIP